MMVKAATFLSFLVICGTVTHAQTTGAASADVTMELNAGTGRYCRDYQGRGRNSTSKSFDIALELPIRVRYGNHRSDTVYLPRGYQWRWQMTVPGQKEPTILRFGGNGASGLDEKSLTNLSHPEEGGRFWVVGGGSGVADQNLSILKFKDTVDDNDAVLIPVLDRFSGLDLRGKIVQIATTRDFRSIPPDLVAKLNEKWKDYGTVWAQVAESDTLTLRIPVQPATQNCNTASLTK